MVRAPMTTKMLSTGLRAALSTLLVLACVACDEDRPTQTRSYFDEGGKEGARKAAGLPEGHPPTGGAQVGTPPPTGAAVKSIVKGTIVVDEALKGQIPHGVLFVIARLPGGVRGPPVLVKKIPSPTFPIPFELTTADAMMPGMPIPEKLKIQARLDQDGDAISRTPGDLFGETQDLVDVGATDVTIALATRNEETKPGMQMGASAPPVPGTGHP